MPKVAWARLVGCTVDQTDAALRELLETKVADIVTDANGNVTVLNRRMVKDEYERKNGRIRQNRYREKRFCNGGITPPSASSSASAIHTPDGVSRIRFTQKQIRDVVLGFKLALGIAECDKAWDSEYFGRYSAPAYSILVRFAGETGKCLDYIENEVKSLKESKLSWTPETLAKRAAMVNA